MWKIEPHTSIDKSFIISGPLELKIDYDDVDHDYQDLIAQMVVDLLNYNWSHIHERKIKEFEDNRVWEK